DSTGDSFRNKAELVQYISNMPNNSVWFIDEIHRLPSKAQDAMLVFLEKGVIDGVQKNVLVIGATTHWGDLREAFLMRFA
ncbi:AAA family ATPase, partial [Streptomyces turgidiscabies]|uniref:AAA family ATPase n=1 Tax=Streptomyces turgidiscabies TaxID=85558 RepID=UPI0038F6DF17